MGCVSICPPPCPQLYFGNPYTKEFVFALFTHQTSTCVPQHAANLSFELLFSILISLGLLSSLAERGCLTSCTSPESPSSLDAAAVW